MVVKACRRSEATIVPNGGYCQGWTLQVVAGVATGSGYQSMSQELVGNNGDGWSHWKHWREEEEGRN